MWKPIAKSKIKFVTKVTTGDLHTNYTYNGCRLTWLINSVCICIIIRSCSLPATSLLPFERVST